MKFRIAIIVSLVFILSGCSWVTGQKYLINVSDYEANRLEDVFGEEVHTHIQNNQLTDDEYEALKAYRAGGEYLLQKYQNIKIESFSKQSENNYEIVFSHEEKYFSCKISLTGDNYICSDNYETSLN